MNKSTQILPILLLATVLLLSGCASASTESQNLTRQILKDFKTQLYTIEDYNKANQLLLSSSMEVVTYIKGFEGFMTEEAFQRFAANRIQTLPLVASENGKFYLKVTDLQVNKFTSEMENKMIIEYTVKLQATYPERNTTENAEETGEIAFTKTSEGWKISNVWFRMNSILERELKMRDDAIGRF